MVALAAMQDQYTVKYLVWWSTTAGWVALTVVLRVQEPEISPGVSSRCAHGTIGKRILRLSVWGELRFQVPRMLLERRSIHKVETSGDLLNMRTAILA